MRTFRTLAWLFPSLASLLVFLVVVPASAQEPAHGSDPSPQTSQPATTLKVDVKLVNVFVTVTDAHGAPVGGLTKENFSLLEDGSEQKISIFDKQSAMPLSIALAIDTSLSTRRNFPLEQASAKRFAH